MPWEDEPGHPFAGIAAKLKRAEESIANLDAEIRAFFSGSKYPVMPDPDSGEWQGAVDYHKERPVPPRFAVLAGEIVHHLRSCLDHVAWYFSCAEYRRDKGTRIGFPVLDQKPQKAGDLKKKFEGISNKRVKVLIRCLQPYRHQGGATAHWLWILNDMDRIDKHREIVLVVSCAGLTFPPGAEYEARQLGAFLSQQKGQAPSDVDSDSLQTGMGSAKVPPEVVKSARVTPLLGFNRPVDEQYPEVISTLRRLLRVVRLVVDQFEGEKGEI